MDCEGGLGMSRFCCVCGHFSRDGLFTSHPSLREAQDPQMGEEPPVGVTLDAPPLAVIALEKLALLATCHPRSSSDCSGGTGGK